MSLYGQNIWVSPPEDLLLIKLSFASEQDLNDARSILIRQKELDMDYLFKEAKKMGVYNKLIELINETKHIRKTKFPFQLF